MAAIELVFMPPDNGATAPIPFFGLVGGLHSIRQREVVHIGVAFKARYVSQKSVVLPTDDPLAA